jgi:hypothetical protein
MKARLLVILGLITLAVLGFGDIALGQNEVTESIDWTRTGDSLALIAGLLLPVILSFKS